jgi:hypothetical protein
VLKIYVSTLAASLLIAAAPAVWAQAPDTKSNRIFEQIQGKAVPNGLGVNVHLDDGLEDLDIAKAMGFRIVRTDVTWSKVETRPGVYDWKPYDKLIARSKELGLVPFLILAYSNPIYAPQWKGTASGRLDWAYAPPVTDRARNAFAAFAARAAERYGKDVIWEVWNEPNLTFGRPAQLDAYLRLAADTCAAMRRAAPLSTIVGPASSGFDWKLLEGFIRSDSSHCFDAVSVHPYRDWDPDSAFTDWRHLKTILNERDPRGRLIAIDSEWGYSVQHGEWTEDLQAAYVTRLYLTDLLAGVPITILYDLRNDGIDRDDKEQNFGLLDAGGKPKPVVAALTNLIRKLDGLTLMGRIRTAPGVTAVVFGRPGRPTIGVAWSSRSSPMPVILGPTVCIVPASAASGSCTSDDVVMQIRMTSLVLDTMPKIFELGLLSTIQHDQLSFEHGTP